MRKSSVRTYATAAGAPNNYTPDPIVVLPQSDKRPSWQEYFKQITQITATRSVCPRLKVGCIFVLDNRLIAQGYNGYLSGCPHEPIIENEHNIATIHAEQNAIIDCAKRGVSCCSCNAYITHYPCFNCMKFLCAAGIKHIYYIDNYNNNENVKILANLKNIKIEKI